MADNPSELIINFKQEGGSPTPPVRLDLEELKKKLAETITTTTKAAEAGAKANESAQKAVDAAKKTVEAAGGGRGKSGGGKPPRPPKAPPAAPFPEGEDPADKNAKAILNAALTAAEAAKVSSEAVQKLVADAANRLGKDDSSAKASQAAVEAASAASQSASQSADKVAASTSEIGKVIRDLADFIKQASRRPASEQSAKSSAAASQAKEVQQAASKEASASVDKIREAISANASAMGEVKTTIDGLQGSIDSLKTVLSSSGQANNQQALAILKMVYAMDNLKTSIDASVSAVTNQAAGAASSQAVADAIKTAQDRASKDARAIQAALRSQAHHTQALNAAVANAVGGSKAQAAQLRAIEKLLAKNLAGSTVARNVTSGARTGSGALGSFIAAQLSTRIQKIVTKRLEGLSDGLDGASKALGAYAQGSRSKTASRVAARASGAAASASATVSAAAASGLIAGAISASLAGLAAYIVTELGRKLVEMTQAINAGYAKYNGVSAQVRAANELRLMSQAMQFSNKYGQQAADGAMAGTSVMLEASWLLAELYSLLEPFLSVTLYGLAVILRLLTYVVMILNALMSLVYMLGELLEKIWQGMKQLPLIGGAFRSIDESVKRLVEEEKNRWAAGKNADDILSRMGRNFFGRGEGGAGRGE